MIRLIRQTTFGRNFRYSHYLRFEISAILNRVFFFNAANLLTYNISSIHTFINLGLNLSNYSPVRHTYKWSYAIDS